MPHDTFPAFVHPGTIPFSPCVRQAVYWVVRAYQMKTVYVMGAGASKHVGYPLISGMGRQLFEWMAAYPDGMFSGSVDLLVERFGENPNIETVITEIGSLI